MNSVEPINQPVATHKERGKRAAARIITKRGGYGKTPGERRAFYGALRRLLMEDEAA